jgi:uncharacterized membrane protein
MTEKAQLPKPEHLSYKKHRKQMANQIILPVLLAALLMITQVVLISISTFRDGGDAGRWAAISTIWIVIPVMLVGLIVLAILIGMIYLMAKALQLIPPYSGLAQDYVNKARLYIIRAADLVVRPILAMDGWIATVQAFFRKVGG